MKKIQWWHKDLEKKNFISKIKKIINLEDLTTGNTTKIYEEQISKLLKVKYSIAVSSGSMGTLLAFMALNVGYKDEIIIPNIDIILKGVTENEVIPSIERKSNRHKEKNVKPYFRSSGL